MTSRARRTVAAPADAVWAAMADPHALARWWPRAVRAEAVAAKAFTLVLRSRRGREVRADFRVTASERPRRRAWRQELVNTPFASVFALSETEVALHGAGGGRTEVAVELRQRLRGSARLGALLVRRANRRQLRAALAALDELVSPGPGA